MESVKRYQIADYLECGSEYALMGVGFNSLNESPNAQNDEKTYINQKSSTNIIKGYKPQFPFDTDLISDETACMALYNVGRNRLTGSDAQMNYVRVELFKPVASKTNTFEARKQAVVVQVDSVEGDGGENMKVTGTLLGVGEFVDGEFNTSTKTFTASSEVTE